MASNIQKWSFKLHDKLCRLYLPPWPIGWDSGYERIEWKTSSRTNYILFAITLSLDIFCVICSGYVVIGYFSFRKNLHDMNIGYAFLIASAGMGVFISVLVVKAFHASPECIQGFNQMIQMRKHLFRDLAAPMRIGVLDLLFPAVAVVAWITPIVVLVIGIAFNVDPIYFLMEDLSGPRIEQSELVKIRNVAVRIVGLYGGFECGRIAGCVAMLLLLVVDIVQASIRALLRHTKESLKKTIWRYILIQMAYRPCRQFILDLLSMLISISYWIMVLMAWLAVKSYSIIPIYFYLLVILVLVTLMVCMYVVLRTVACAGELCAQLIAAMIHRSKKESMDRHFVRTDLMKIANENKKKAGALRKMTFSYHPFVELDTKYVFDMADNLTGQLIDFLIMFEI